MPTHADFMLMTLSQVEAYKEDNDMNVVYMAEQHSTYRAALDDYADDLKSRVLYGIGSNPPTPPPPPPGT